MQHSTNHPNRKKFVWWGAALLTSLTAFKFFTPRKKLKKPIVQMLTQDGRLVIVDKGVLANGKKITDKELQQWVKR
ncbi:MAG TPA: hypothetical protein VMZ03_11430 [Chitinophagaceae bacterium]|nr:hypothetical protein [Chitinophagaceae bacterium]